MAKGASPEPYRSLTLKFKETDNSFPFRRASVLQYHIPFLSFHCLVKPALIIKDCYPGSYAQREGVRGKVRAGKSECEQVREKEKERWTEEIRPTKKERGREIERERENKRAGAWLGKVFPTLVLHHPDSRPIMLRWKVRRILREFNIPRATAFCAAFVTSLSFRRVSSSLIAIFGLFQLLINTSHSRSLYIFARERSYLLYFPFFLFPYILVTFEKATPSDRTAKPNSARGRGKIKAWEEG